MMFDFSAPESEEIVIGVFVGLIVLSYVGFVYFCQDGESVIRCTISEEMTKPYNII